MELSGNGLFPYLIWDVLTYPDRSFILRSLRKTVKNPTTTE